LGTRTFGKGSVQTVIPLSDGSAIRLTTSKYFSPNGNVIHGQGINPDIIVEEGKIELAEQEEKSIADIFQQLEESEGKEEQAREIPKKYLTDNQLMRAVDVLKAIKIYKRK
jgi:carboxyl-terminal processing protease